MKNLKKKLSICLSTCMLLSGSLSAFASEPIGNISMTENTTYTYEDVEGNVYTTTDMELLADGWNPANLNGEPVELYADFPMSIESHMNNKAELSMNLLYLRTIGANDSVTLRIAERENGTVFMEEALTAENDLIFIPSIPLGKVYNITVTHGNQAYSAVIETKYDSVSLPGNISLTGTQNPTDRKVKITEARTEENAGEELEDYLIPASELPELYQDLSADKLYIIQASDVLSNQHEISKAFFSKDLSLQDLGFFVPRHFFYTEDEYINRINNLSPLSLTNTLANSTTGHMGEASWELEDLENNDKLMNYRFDRDIFLNLTRYSYRIFKITAEQNTNFTYKTMGNSEINRSYWIYDPETGDFSYNFVPTRDTNVNTSTGLAEGVIMYILLYVEAPSSFVFNLKHTDTTDDVTNSIYGLLNPESGTRTYSAYSTVYSHGINYGGDVDVFYVNNTTNHLMNGNYSARLKYLSGNAGGLVARLYVDEAGDGYIYEDTSVNLVASAGETYAMDFELTSYGNFFIEITSNSHRTTGTYNLELLKPNTPDPYETNNSYSNSTPLTTDSAILEDVTLHQGDKDNFIFNTGAGGADIFVRIYRTDTDMLYNISLSTDDTSYTGNNNGTTASTNVISVTNLAPNMDCYIRVSSNGTNYSPGCSYYLDYEITRYPAPTVYTATLDGNVNIAVGEEDTLTDLSTLFTPIMEQLTCHENGTAVADATAQADVKLYYMNGTTKTELTTAIVNNLTAGNYAITVEYQNVAATGGTVTLNVEAPVVGTIIDLNTVTMVTLTTNTAALDWAACAQMAANSRLTRENQNASTINHRTAARAITGSLTTRGTIDDAAAAADYIYTGINDDFDEFFFSDSISVASAENFFLSELQTGRTVILQLVSKTTPSDMSLARYILIKGINTGTHQYKVIDPVLGTESWVSQSTVYDGYNGNTDLQFSGIVLDC